MANTRVITVTLQFGKEGVDPEVTVKLLRQLLLDNTNAEVVLAEPGIARLIVDECRVK